MYILLLSFTMLPNMGFPTAVGVIPLRYLWFPLFFAFRFIKKDLLVLLIAACIFLLYPLIAVNFGRRVSPYDIGMVLVLILCVFQLSIVYKKTALYSRFIIFLFACNFIYSIIQVLILKAGLPSSLAMIHQNSHAAGYVIPNSSFFPYLPRFTGLFIESAPFVIYVAFTYLFFSLNHSPTYLKILALVLLFLSGAKSAVLFVLLAFLYEMKLFKYINIKFFTVLAIIISYIVFLNSESIFDFLKSSPYALGSIYLRLGWVLDSAALFLNDANSLIFGMGVVSTSSGINGEATFRGLDFFSYFIMSNGLLGSVILLFPIFLYIKEISITLSNNEKVALFVFTFVALMISGSLANYQYTYLITIILVIHLRRVRIVVESDKTLTRVT